MASKIRRSDVLVYFTSSPQHNHDPVLLDIEKIELWKHLKTYVPDAKNRELAALIETMCVIGVIQHDTEQPGEKGSAPQED